MHNSPIKQENKRNPVEKANVFSQLTFFYVFRIFRKGFKNGLKEEDLYLPLKEHKSSVLGEKLEKIWRQEFKKHKKSALHRALFKLVGPQFIWLGIVKLIDEIALVVVMPLSIGRLVSFFEKNQTRISENDAYLSAGAIILCLLVSSYLLHPSIFGLEHMTMKLRLACSSLVYRKALKLSRSALASTTIGQLVNLLSNDVSKFDEGFLLAHFAWIGPVQTAVGTYLLYREIGIAAFCGIAFLLCFMPIQIWIAKRTSVLRLKTALRTDERVRLMNEIISGVQVIKMYCWEKPFSQLISIARKKEMNAIRSHSYLNGLLASFEMFLTRTSVFISILTYVLLGSYITAEKVFAIMSIYNALSQVITVLFATSISSIAEVNVSVMRIQKFLSSDEKEEPNDLDESNKIKPRIVFEDANAKWSKELSEHNLKNVSLSVASNQFVAVIGPVGSGKSNLLNCILRELPLESGKMDVQGKIAYSSQEPWLFSASVRQNILFGSEFNEERYEEVCNACALKSDFKLLPHGDKTLVGEGGKTLSGGQKARVSLARCIYKQADIYLLDDPLSAVDAKVGKHLYEKCIKDYLKNSICVLVTHQLQYTRNADKIIIMKDGKIEMEGNYEELQNSGIDFVKLFEQFHNEDEEEKDKKTEDQVEENEDEDEDGPMEEKEKMSSGSVKAALYITYFRAGGGAIMIGLLVAFFLMGQFTATGGDYYISYWVNLEQDLAEQIHNNISKQNETIIDRNVIIYTYSGITLSNIVFSVAHSLYFMQFFIIASINLHRTAFQNVIKASMKFFNINPSGRILNRFSKDLGYIDEYIPELLFTIIEIFLQLSGALIVSYIVEPVLLIPTLVLFVTLYFFRVVYIRTSRDVKRIEGIRRSPVFSHMAASMRGLSTVRAFHAEELLIQEFDNHQDNHSSAWFMFLTSNTCFALWLDMTCIVFMAVAIFVLLYFSKNIYGGDIGLIITQYLGIVGPLEWGVRQWSELENHMISVERVLEYQNIESEPERQIYSKLPKAWPEEGRIEFKNVYLKYSSDDEPVLKNLNFTIEPKEKIGIVGRTGAGKSSTITALFQLYPIEGSILIDNVDTTKLPLDELRSKISIIPQDPVLFSGTMRKNLDPFDEYSDEILWNALDQVQLKEVISELPSGLNSNVSEGGSNFSVGQKQLVCFARALIRNNKILVMDEATANVDHRTDALIQNTIREKFAECTVLTIAHRLHTVMDSDKILLMNAGTVEQFDHPYRLLQNKDGMLYHLVQTTGKITAQNLEAVSKENYENKMEK